MLLRSAIAVGLLAAMPSFVSSVPALAQNPGDYRSQLRPQVYPPTIPFTSDPEVTGNTGRRPSAERLLGHGLSGRPRRFSRPSPSLLRGRAQPMCLSHRARRYRRRDCA